MTNLEKIRAMSARELAKELCFTCCFCIHSDNICKNNDCYESRLEWLNQEDNPIPLLKIRDIVETVDNRYVVLDNNVAILVAGKYCEKQPAFISEVNEIIKKERKTLKLWVRLCR